MPNATFESTSKQDPQLFDPPRTRARAKVATATGGVIVLAILLAACSSPAKTEAQNPTTSTSTTTQTQSTDSAPTTSAPTTTSTTESPTTTTTAPPTTTTTTPVHTANLSVGSTGAAVLALQQKLTSLGYWLGTPNGVFGDSTQQAVYAYQKAAGVTADGVVGPKTQAALARNVRPTPRPFSGSYVIEVNLQNDLVMFVKNGVLEYVINTSTGGGYTYKDGNGTAVAITPTGLFHSYREVDGTVTDSLGTLWRPIFFTGGFAIHGDSYVPSTPVSHGCVRVSDEAIDWIWASNLDPIGTPVWVFS